MAAWHGDVYAGVSYPVGAYWHGEVVFQGEVNAGIVFVGLARMGCTIIKGVINHWGPYVKEKAPPVDYEGPKQRG